MFLKRRYPIRDILDLQEQPVMIASNDFTIKEGNTTYKSIYTLFIRLYGIQKLKTVQEKVHNKVNSCIL